MALLRWLGTTAIRVTHDQDEALATADRIGVLNGGRLEQVGPPAELYERPATRFVASFLGAANLLDAEVRESGPHRRVLALRGGAEVAAPGSSLPVGAAVTLGVRPERVRVGDGQPGEGALWGTVKSSLYRGTVLDVALRLRDGTALRASQALGEELGPLPAVGERVCVGWRNEAGIVLEG